MAVDVDVGFMKCQFSPFSENSEKSDQKILFTSVLFQDYYHDPVYNFFKIIFNFLKIKHF